VGNARSPHAGLLFQEGPPGRLQAKISTSSSSVCRARIPRQAGTPTQSPVAFEPQRAAMSTPLGSRCAIALNAIISYT
jgi:hypothetical protein